MWIEAMVSLLYTKGVVIIKELLGMKDPIEHICSIKIRKIDIHEIAIVAIVELL